MSDTISVRCPRCHALAEIKECDAPVGLHNPICRHIYTCPTCKTPECNVGGDDIYYRPITFLSDGSEVI